MKAILCVPRAERPAVLRLMTSEAGASVGSEILEKTIFRGYCRPLGLKGCDSAARVQVYLQLRYNRWCRLRVSVNIGKKPPHLLGVLDCACSRHRESIGLGVLRDCNLGISGEQSRYCQARGGQRELRAPSSSREIHRDSPFNSGWATVRGQSVVFKAQTGC